MLKDLSGLKKYSFGKTMLNYGLLTSLSNVKYMRMEKVWLAKNKEANK